MKVFDLHSDLFTDIAFRRARGETNVFDRIHYPTLKKGGGKFNHMCVLDRTYFFSSTTRAFA